jgi:hypothetical protein
LLRFGNEFGQESGFLDAFALDFPALFRFDQCVQSLSSAGYGARKARIGGMRREAIRQPDSES